MPSRPQVRDAQRILAALDAAHGRAVARLRQAEQRRDEVLADQERQVAAARAEVEQAVVAMANDVGADLAAQLLTLDVRDVRRLVRTATKEAVA